MANKAKKFMEDENLPMNIDDDEVVCFCMNTTFGAIKQAVAAGAKTMEEVNRLAPFGTVCGGCKEHIGELIDKLIRINAK